MEKTPNITLPESESLSVQEEQDKSNVASLAEIREYEPHYYCHEDEFIKEWLFDVRMQDKFIGVPYSHIKTVILEGDELVISTECWHIEISGCGLRPIYDGLIRNNLVYVSCARRYEDDKGDKETFVSDIKAVRV